jgi:hypothetical protein
VRFVGHAGLFLRAVLKLRSLPLARLFLAQELFDVFNLDAIALPKLVRPKKATGAAHGGFFRWRN